MKVLTVILFLLTLRLSIAQNADADLNGKVFSGTATEIIQPDADKLPLMLDETIRFENGNIYFNLLSGYSSVKLPYTSEVDNRRMIAVTVITFSSNYSGIINGKEVYIEFSGEVLAYKNLSGNFIIKFSGGRELKYQIIAKSE